MLIFHITLQAKLFQINKNLFVLTIFMLTFYNMILNSVVSYEEVSTILTLRITTQNFKRIFQLVQNPFPILQNEFGSKSCEFHLHSIETQSKSLRRAIFDCRL